MKKILFTISILSSIFIGCTKQEGCTEPNATNYDKAAEKNDGSCVYGTTTSTTSGTTTGGSNTGGTSNTTANTVTDIEGNTYGTVTIGSQVWMAENLKVTKCNDGTPIALISADSSWSAAINSGYCWYNNDKGHAELWKYGALYNGYVINDCNVCPNGWHIPNETEWDELIEYVAANGHDGDESTALRSTNGYDPPACGNCIGDGNGIDVYGFNGKPSGNRDNNTGKYWTERIAGIYWTSSQVSGSVEKQYWNKGMGNHQLHVTREDSHVNFGLSIRCVKD